MRDKELERLMLNWAAWVVKRPRNMAFTGAYNPDPWRREEGPRILIDHEAEAVDRAVHGLEPQLKQVVVEYWCKQEPIPRKVRRCGCSERTFWRRLENAHRAIRDEIQARRETAEKAQKVRSSLALSNLRAEVAGTL